jgi:hypothetical protein
MTATMPRIMVKDLTMAAGFVIQRDLTFGIQPGRSSSLWAAAGVARAPCCGISTLAPAQGEVFMMESVSGRPPL